MAGKQKDMMIEAVEKIELNPGDILVAKIRPGIFSALVQSKIRAALELIIEKAGKENPVIVIKDGDLIFEVAEEEDHKL